MGLGRRNVGLVVRQTRASGRGFMGQHPSPGAALTLNRTQQVLFIQSIACATSSGLCLEGHCAHSRQGSGEGELRTQTGCFLSCGFLPGEVANVLLGRKCFWTPCLKSNNTNILMVQIQEPRQPPPSCDTNQQRTGVAAQQAVAGERLPGSN